MGCRLLYCCCCSCCFFVLLAQLCLVAIFVPGHAGGVVGSSLLLLEELGAAGRLWFDDAGSAHPARWSSMSFESGVMVSRGH